MIKSFAQHIKSQALFTKQHRLLLAISGGIDSVVLCHLLSNLKYKPDLVHCNFKLRAKDSDLDEKFCRDLANTLGLRIHVKNMPAKTYAKGQGISIQMAARELRYAWFAELLKEHAYDFLLTAHHANDSAETMLLNLFRGTGSKGLLGIQTKNAHILRPLLPFHKKDIVAYAASKGIKYRLDKSNEEDKYKRNLLRLKIVPLIKKINPDFETALAKTAELLSQERLLAQAFVDDKKAQLLQKKADAYVVKVCELLKEKHFEAICGHLFHDFGFNQSQIQKLCTAITAGKSGKVFRSPSHVINVSFGELLIKTPKEKSQQSLYFHDLTELGRHPNFSLGIAKEINALPQDSIYLSETSLSFPLCLRVVKKGDKFKPFGMKGFKLLSDFLKEQKVPVTERKHVQLLENGDGCIVWVVGYRSDERFRIHKSQGQILVLTHHGN